MSIRTLVCRKKVCVFVSNGCVCLTCLATNYCGTDGKKYRRATTTNPVLNCLSSRCSRGELNSFLFRPSCIEWHKRKQKFTYTPERHPNIQRPQNLYIFESHWKSNSNSTSSTLKTGPKHAKIGKIEEKKKKQKTGRTKRSIESTRRTTT